MMGLAEGMVPRQRLPLERLIMRRALFVFCRKSPRAAAGIALPILLAGLAFSVGQTHGAPLDVVRFGAKPDGRSLCTAAIQKALDACAAQGGGVVRLAKGTYLSGTLFLRSRVTLELDEGATLLGSTDLADYPHKTPSYPTRMNDDVTQSLIYAERLEHVGLRGKGRIDGQGAAFRGPNEVMAMPGRPFLIRMIECKDVWIEDLTLRNSPAWMESYIACDDLTIRGIHVDNHVNWNNDAIDIDSCRHVHICDVEANCDDDGLCFKGTSLRSTQDVLVENCSLRSYCNSLKFGTDSMGGLLDVRIRKCDLGQPPAGSPPPLKGRPASGISGMSWEVVDGGTLRNLVVDQITIHGTRAPIFLRLADRGRHLRGNPIPPPGVLRDVSISNVQGDGAGPMGCPIAGISGHPIENLTLRNIRLSFAGGGKKEDTVRRFDEKTKHYPEATIFAPRLPAFGLFCWHVKGLTLENVRLTTIAADQRPDVALEDARDVMIDGRKVDPAGKETAGKPLARNKQ
jgi:polygalacturonase